MTNATILTLLGNVSQSLFAVQKLILGGSYVFGLGFVLYSLLKFFELTAKGTNAQTRYSPPVFYLIGGVALIYFPSSITTLGNTAFGSTQSLLQYSTYEPYNIYDSIRILIHTAGLIWFFRGTVFLMQSSQSNGQQSRNPPGKKGIAYICASVCATNFESATAMCYSIILWFMKWF